MKIACANIVTAFDENALGTKVQNRQEFMRLLADAVAAHDFSVDDQPGQALITLPDEACEYVSAGVGPRSDNPGDYTLRFYRGRVNAYLRREFAVPVESVRVVIYTRDAYLSDPDVVADPGELDRIGDATHVLVAVLASAGDDAPLGVGRLVANIAGGNKEWVWGKDRLEDDTSDLESATQLYRHVMKIERAACAAIAYEDKWSVVADASE